MNVSYCIIAFGVIVTAIAAPLIVIVPALMAGGAVVVHDATSHGPIVCIVVQYAPLVKKPALAVPPRVGVFGVFMAS
jgi:hypothetical protein